MKARRFKETPRNSASAPHKKFYSLITSMFSNNLIYQEYPYYYILEKGYKEQNVESTKQNSVMLSLGKRLFADFFDNTLGIIYEIQGEQHYNPILWSKKIGEGEKALSKFQSQKRTDQLKRDIVIEAGFILIEIPFSDFDVMNEEYVWKKLKEKYGD